MDTLPADLQELVDAVDRADAAADALVADLSEEQFHWQPDEGRAWSIAQCLEHLATSNVVYGNAIRDGIDAAKRRRWTRKGPIAPGFIGRKFVQSMEPPVRRALRSPAVTTPGPGLPKDEVMRRYHEAHESVRALVRDSAAIDVNRARFRNPFVPVLRFSIGTGLRVIAAHDRRHLWQASRVRETPGFPGASRD